MGAVYSQSLKQINDVLENKADIDKIGALFSELYPWDVGGVVVAHINQTVNVVPGYMVQGSELMMRKFESSTNYTKKGLNAFEYSFSSFPNNSVSIGLSGTWKSVTYSYYSVYNGVNYYYPCIWVRVL